ncbi:MAG: hypothetical protein R3F37_18795 [Candidatus Competibacteraceae bacterium]
MPTLFRHYRLDCEDLRRSQRGGYASLNLPPQGRRNLRVFLDDETAKLVPPNGLFPPRRVIGRQCSWRSWSAATVRY